MDTPALASNPLDAPTADCPRGVPDFWELVDVIADVTAGLRLAEAVADGAIRDAAAMKMRAIQAEHDASTARAEERRRIALLIQDAASGGVLMATREALLELREQVLALEDSHG